MNKKGFTLLELLIVIGVLGILAAGLLAAIDPFEQLKKARDANNRNATIEVLNGFTRYYATHGAFPWNLTTNPIDCDGGAAASQYDAPDALGTDAALTTDIPNCIDAIQNDGELKDTFETGIGSTSIFVASDPADSTDLHVCFSPESKSLRSDSNTKWYLTAGGGGENIVTEDDGTNCPDVTVDTCLQCFE